MSDQTQPIDVFDGSEARIIDRGYRSYDGERTGVTGAMRAVFTHSFQRALGLRRGAWAKVLPFATVIFAYLPAIVLVGIVALFPDELMVADEAPIGAENVLPTYGDYYGSIIAAIMIFVAVAAPEVLCTDRRTGMLGIYLASPLDRDSYLGAKALSICATLSLVCVGPPLLLLVANILQSSGPTGAAEILETLGRVLLAGGALTLMFAGLSMGIAASTDRKFVATAGIVILFLMSLSVVGTLVGVGIDDSVSAWSPTLLSFELSKRAHGETGDVMPGASSLLVWGAWAAWTIGGFALARVQLRRLAVTR